MNSFPYIMIYIYIYIYHNDIIYVLLTASSKNYEYIKYYLLSDYKIFQVDTKVQIKHK